MKKILLRSFIFILAVMLVITTTRSGDSISKKKKSVKPCFTQEEIRFLMKANHFSQQEAVTLLEWSCVYPVRP